MRHVLAGEHPWYASPGAGPLPVANALHAFAIELSGRRWSLWFGEEGAAWSLAAAHAPTRQCLLVSAIPFHPTENGAERVFTCMQRLRDAPPLRGLRWCPQRWRAVLLATCSALVGSGGCLRQQWIRDFFVRIPGSRRRLRAPVWGDLSAAARVGRPLRVCQPVDYVVDDAALERHLLGMLVWSS